MAQTRSTAKPKTAPRAKPAQAKRPNAKRSDTPALEWVAAAVGLIATIAVISVISWEALAGGDAPPSMQVALKRVALVEGGYVAEFEVANRGERPAAQVTVEGVLKPIDGETETSEATFDYVPDGSVRAGGLFFKSDPRSGVLQLGAKGFVEP